jgi:hypothetical protein
MSWAPRAGRLIRRERGPAAGPPRGLVITPPAIERVLKRLGGVRRLRSGWLARCPAHQDRSPSLKIDEGEAGRILVHCFSGCTAQEIVAAIGLTLHDLMGDSSAPPPRSPAKALAADLLREQKWTRPEVLELYQLADLQRAVDAFVADVRRTETAKRFRETNWDRLALAAGLETEALALGAEIGAPW